MEVEPALVADGEAPEAIQPGVRALDHPPMAPERGARVDLLPRDAADDAPHAARGPTAGNVIGLIRVHLRRTVTSVPLRRTDAGDRIEDRLEGHGVVPVRRPEHYGQRDPRGVRNNMALRARFALICRVGAGSRVPFFTPFAGMLAESSAARRQSILAAAPS